MTYHEYIINHLNRTFEVVQNSVHRRPHRRLTSSYSVVFELQTLFSISRESARIVIKHWGQQHDKIWTDDWFGEVITVHKPLHDNSFYGGAGLVYPSTGRYEFKRSFRPNDEMVAAIEASMNTTLGLDEDLETILDL